MNPQTPQTPPQAPPLPPSPELPVAPLPPEVPEQPLATPQPVTPPVNAAFQPLAHDFDNEPAPKVTKKRNFKFGLSLVFFVIFAILCFMPLTPGFVVAGLPGNSDSLDVSGNTGDCNGTTVAATNSTDYQNKKGLPLSYNYSEVVTSSIDCAGAKQFVGSSSISVTNLIAVAINALSAVLLTVLASLLVKRLRHSA